MFITIIIGIKLCINSVNTISDSIMIEYPRINKTLKKLHMNNWNKYYQCLDEQHLKIGSKTLSAISLMAFKETSVM